MGQDARLSAADPTFGRTCPTIVRVSQWGQSKAALFDFCFWAESDLRCNVRFGGRLEMADFRFRAIAVRGTSSPKHNPRAVLLRQKSICDDQRHHARENQQCREGFSDHWCSR